jgi:hypothetical protein
VVLFIYGLFNNAASTSDSTALNAGTVREQRIWNEVIAAWSQDFLGWTGENQEKHLPG